MFSLVVHVPRPSYFKRVNFHCKQSYFIILLHIYSFILFIFITMYVFIIITLSLFSFFFFPEFKLILL